MRNKILIVEDQFIEADYLRSMLVKAGYIVCGIPHSAEKARIIIENEKPDLVLLDIFLSGGETGIDLARELRKKNIAFVFLSANSNEEVLEVAKTTEPYGFLVKPFREKDLLITLEIAQYRHEHSVESEYRREYFLKSSLLDIVGNGSAPEAKLLAMAGLVQPFIPFDYLVVALGKPREGKAGLVSFQRTGYNEYQTVGAAELKIIYGNSQAVEKMIDTLSGPAREGIYSNKSLELFCHQSQVHADVSRRYQAKSMLVFPLAEANHPTVNFFFYSRQQDIYQPRQLALLNQLRPVILESVIGVPKHKNSHQEVVTASPDEAEKSSEAFSGIIGKSHLLLGIFDNISVLAPTDTSVIIFGESGTGKEHIADCIHQLSERREKPIVRINCATLPPTLIESELFGHEKGAFTGATEKRIGKFEKASGGTIFLDEIGEMPVELQVKLLRVLQEKEIERIGGNNPLKVDVRIIAATNRNLEKEVAEGRFRLDLYYRLNVFPIELPPLRKRKEDIPLLAEHFIEKFNRKSGKRIRGVSQEALKNMMDYHWPGNIRELEHTIERSLLLEKGTILNNISIKSLQNTPAKKEEEHSQIKTIMEHERDYIIDVLKRCNGRVWGTGAAAEKMNIPPSTLKSKMKKLGIRKEFAP